MPEKTAKYRFEQSKVYQFDKSGHCYIYLCNYMQCDIKASMSYKRKELLANEYVNYLDQQSYD